MWDYVINELRKKRYIQTMIIAFIFFMSIYTLLDHFNGGYYMMLQRYGVYLIILNILINVIMAGISAFMFGLSSAYFNQSKKEGKGTILSAFSIIFGILTYGCTSCVIAFFATIGITFSVALLPLANFPYKLIALVIVLLGFLWLRHEIKNAKCKLKKYTSQRCIFFYGQKS